MRSLEKILWIFIFVLVLLVLGKIFIRLFPYLLVFGTIAYLFFWSKSNNNISSNKTKRNQDNHSSKLKKETDFEIEDAEFEIDDEEDDTK